MYEYITGKLAELNPAYAVIEAGGIGYFINISLQTYSELEGHEEAMLYLHHAVREDAQTLYGFATRAERELFRLLIGVSGVGGNTARMIQSTYSPSELRNIIATGNAVLLKNVKGLGLKTAQKIIVDLSGRMLELKGNDVAMTAIASGARNETFDEALSALVMLGFQKTASEKVLTKIFKESPTTSVEEAIKFALKHL
ncbi:MAG: Holliday junction branch migration protein RuvA [Alistipes sp.]|jgi:Holliday junction DNA helicase RuvA|nr:Holliday junction branch migration protein RuvA [Alistipes sp.]